MTNRSRRMYRLRVKVLTSSVERSSSPSNCRVMARDQRAHAIYTGVAF